MKVTYLCQGCQFTSVEIKFSSQFLLFVFNSWMYSAELSTMQGKFFMKWSWIIARHITNLLKQLLKLLPWQYSIHCSFVRIHSVSYFHTAPFVNAILAPINSNMSSFDSNGFSGPWHRAAESHARSKSTWLARTRYNIDAIVLIKLIL